MNILPTQFTSVKPGENIVFSSVDLRFTAALFAEALRPATSISMWFAKNLGTAQTKANNDPADLTVTLDQVGTRDIANLRAVALDEKNVAVLRVTSGEAHIAVVSLAQMDSYKEGRSAWEV